MKKIRLILVSVLLCACLGGCAQQVNGQLKEKTLVQGMGVDWENGKYTVTLQVLDVGKAASAGEAEDQLTKVYSSSGETIQQAMSDNNRILGREIFSAQNQLVVLGESAAKFRLEQVMDYFIRAYDTRPNVELAMAMGPAEDILRAPCAGAKIPAQKIREELRNSVYYGKSAPVQVMDAVNVLMDPTRDLYLPVLSLTGEKEEQDVAVEPMAVFHGNAFAGFLEEQENRGALWMLGKVKGGALAVSLSPYGTVTLRVLSARANIRVKRTSPLEYDVDIACECDISQVESSPSTQLSEQDIEQVETLAANVIKEEAEGALRVCQLQSQCDLWGFGQRLGLQDGALYRRLAPTWSSEFARLRCAVSAAVTLKNSGQISVAS